jgi:hypothetical protein
LIVQYAFYTVEVYVFKIYLTKHYYESNIRSVSLKRSVTPRINSSIGMFAFRAISSGLSRGGSLSTCVVVGGGRTTRLIRLVFGRSEGRVFFFGVGLGTCF